MKRIFLYIFGIIALSLSVLFIFPKNNKPQIHHDKTSPIPIPLVENDPFAYLAKGGTPQEQRDIKYRKWLAASLKIQVSGASGSGTIIYFDNRDGYAYVQSCGHLWNGSMKSEEGKRKNIKCKVVTWYQNDKKLPDPQEYPAEVLFYNNPAPNDVSLLRFKPDWIPEYYPIAPADFKFVENMRFHSCGCDGAREVAHYDVRYLGMRGGDIVTTENSPRPGRSGGGLMTEDYYVGICWGTTDTSGNGNGFFTPLLTLRKHNEINGYGWLNEVGIGWARQLPIVDRNGRQLDYPKNYIPIPGK